MSSATAAVLGCPCGSTDSYPACCAVRGAGWLDPEQVRRWATGHGIAEQLRVSLGTVLATRGGSVTTLPAWLRNRTAAGDLLFDPSVRLAALPAPLLVSLRSAAWDFLAEERASVQAAIAAESRPPVPPREPDLALLAQRLLELRRHLRELTAPRQIDRLPGARVWIDAPARRLYYSESSRVCLPGATVQPGLALSLARAREEPLPLPRCTCGAEGGCAHLLAAIDLALASLCVPAPHAEWDALARELGTPDWSRALAALDAVRAGRRREAEREPEARISFRLVRPGNGGALAPQLHFRKRGGTFGPGRRPTTRELAEAIEELDREDRLTLQRLGYLPLAGHEILSGYPLREIPAAEAAPLAGHPRIYASADTVEPVALQEAPLALRLEPHPAGGLQVTPTAGGVPLAPAQLRALLGDERTAGAFLHLVPDRRACFLVRPPDAEVARGLARALDHHGQQFPPEAEGALLERVEALQELLPVELSSDLLAEEVAPEARLVVRLALRAEGLDLWVLARPLAGAPPQPPGEGPARLFASLGGARRSAVRDLASERAVASALIERLALPAPPAAPGFHRPVEDDSTALELLERLRTLPASEVTAEWVGAEPRLVRCSSARQLRVEVRDQGDWFGLAGEMEIDGQRVKLALLLEALRERLSVVRLEGGAWLALSRELAERLAPLAHAAAQSPGGLVVGPGAIALLDDLARDGAELDASGAFARLRERMRSAASRAARVPRSFRGKLRDYQRDGFRWLERLSSWGAGAVLADDMGLGKTAQALALLCHRAAEGPALVVAPTSVCANWVAEAARFAPSLRVSLFRDADRHEALEALGPGDVLVTSYGLLALDLPRFSGKRFATLVLDEAQAVKNAATRRARAARELTADFRLLLSGTPLENHLGELWSLFRVAFPDLLGSWERFRETLALPIERDGDPVRRRALAATLRPFLLRRTKDEVARELPSRTEVTVPVVLSPAERQLYEQARLAAVARLAGLAEEPGGRSRFQVLAAITDLRLLACHPRLRRPDSRLPSAKLQRFLALVGELREEGHRALVFSQFTSHLALVRAALDAAGASYLYLDGQTPPAQRDRLVERFQAGEGALFLISLKAGGTGLNLTGADYVIHLDPWWNPAVEDQATDRAHRIGQRRPVTVYRLVSQGTIEEAIVALHARKRELVAGVLDGMEMAGRLSMAELMALIRAGPEPEAALAREPEAEARALEAEETDPVTAVPEAGGAGGGEPARAAVPAPYGELAQRFAAHLEEEHVRGGLRSRGTVRSYARAAARFLEYLRRERLPAPRSAAEVVAASARYGAALASGAFTAPPSEALVARGALPRLARFLGDR